MAAPPKKVLGLRVSEEVTAKFKALATVFDVDQAVLMEQLVEAKEADLNDDQKEAFNALLKVWGVTK